jgi:hypothetical protein
VWSLPKVAVMSLPTTSATIDWIDSAYREAGGDSFMTADFLESTQDTQPQHHRISRRIEDLVA